MEQEEFVSDKARELQTGKQAVIRKCVQNEMERAPVELPVVEPELPEPPAEAAPFVIPGDDYVLEKKELEQPKDVPVIVTDKHNKVVARYVSVAKAAYYECIPEEMIHKHLKQGTLYSGRRNNKQYKFYEGGLVNIKDNLNPPLEEQKKTAKKVS